jgi:4-hydroxybenzoate polyprenyltransferase
MVGSAFVFFLGREIVLDVNDMKGDREHGRLTLAILVGRTTAIRIAQALLVVSCVIAMPIPFMIDSTIGRSLAVGGILCLLYICVAVAPRLSNRNAIESFAVLSSRVFLVNAPMVCLALWVG